MHSDPTKRKCYLGADIEVVAVKKVHAALCTRHGQAHVGDRDLSTLADGLDHAVQLDPPLVLRAGVGPAAVVQQAAKGVYCMSCTAAASLLRLVQACCTL